MKRQLIAIGFWTILQGSPSPTLAGTICLERQLVSQDYEGFTLVESDESHVTQTLFLNRDESLQSVLGKEVIEHLEYSPGDLRESNGLRITMGRGSGFCHLDEKSGFIVNCKPDEPVTLSLIWVIFDGQIGHPIHSTVTRTDTVYGHLINELDTKRWFSPGGELKEDLLAAEAMIWLGERHENGHVYKLGDIKKTYHKCTSWPW